MRIITIRPWIISCDIFCFMNDISYLRQAQHPRRWEMTDSELLAGIDGIFISQQISSWVHHLRRMRLSQIIDMYYSGRGIPILAIESTNNSPPINSVHRDVSTKSHAVPEPADNDSESIHVAPERSPSRSRPMTFNYGTNSKLRAIFDHPDWEWKKKNSAVQANILSRFSISDGINRACNRKEILSVIDRDKLKDETYFLSQILQFSTSSMAISDEDLRANCDATVDRFFNYSGYKHSN